MKYDIETLEADLLSIVQTYLPAKLAEITAEKADSITLTVPVADDYFNTTDDEVNNRKLSVQYGVIDGQPLSIGPQVAEDNRYIFLVYLDETNLKTGVARKMLFRYIRALKEVFQENFRRIHCCSLMTVQSIAPTSASWDENENSPVYKVGGVYINAAIAG